MSEFEFVVTPEHDGARLDSLVAAETGASRSAVARLIDGGSVTVESARRARSFRVSEGQHIRGSIPLEEVSPPQPESLDVPIRYEDEWLLVVAKPAGLVVHPAPGNPGGTLVNALLSRPGPPAGGEVQRPGIVHRLDAGTSGLMIVAKDEAAFERLTEMMANREVSRTYLALVEGVPATASGTIDAPIGRSTRNRKKMGVVAGGRDSVTDFRVVESFNDASLLEVKPRTGRTHQIRVHLAAVDHAVIGDAVYGKNRTLAKELSLERPFLHAAALRFTHPMTGADVALSEPLPEDLESALSALRTG